MSEPFIAEIRMFPYTFSPDGWAYCNGTSINQSQNPALFSIISTTFGGSASSGTFNLPDLRGLAAVHPDNQTFYYGKTTGSNTVSLTSSSQLPPHNHSINAAVTSSSSTAYLGSNTPAANSLLTRSTYAVSGQASPNVFYGYNNPDSSPSANMHVATIGSSGATGGAHENRQPFLVLPFCIALIGEYPLRP